MPKCISCKQEKGIYNYMNKGELYTHVICDNCVGFYFTCPDCGTLFDQEDKLYGDQGNGFCKDCAHKH